jgi:hypothetical protein
LFPSDLAIFTSATTCLTRELIKRALGVLENTHSAQITIENISLGLEKKRSLPLAEAPLVSLSHPGCRVGFEEN